MKRIGLSWFFLPCYFFGQTLYEESDEQIVQSMNQTYAKGLGFLASAQNKDGSWPDGSHGVEPGVVGMAILALLARGDDPEYGPYAENIHRSINFLLTKQDKKSGFIGHTMYTHAFSTLALAEAYGAANDPRIGTALERAVSLIVMAQKKNSMGGWRYSPESVDADVTVSGAQLITLLAARNAGLKIPKESIEKGREFLLICQEEKGGFGYTNSTGANLPRTSIGSLVLSLSGENETKEYKKTVAYLHKNAKYDDQGHKFYNLYYTSQAVFRADPKLWQSWNRENLRKLKGSQAEDGSWNGNYGKAFSTSAALLSLALNYRYLPIYER